ncbi:MAG: thioredoxin family protein [Truepera sp.]|nr:thioredoxin family protein [Truepera sp.]
MPILDDALQQQVRDALAPLVTPVEMIVYTGSSLVIPGQDAPGQQEETLKLLREVAATSDKLTVIERSLVGDQEAAALGITLAPTTLLREAGTSRHNIRFSGLPGGYEFQTLIETLLLLGTGQSRLSHTSQQRLAAIATPVTLQSFVTPTCPYCPRAVITAFELAYHHPQIRAEGIEANEFPALSQRHRISGVPDTIISGTTTERVLGAQPERAFVEATLKAAGVALVTPA